MAKKSEKSDMTTAELAEKLGITVCSVRGLIKRGHFPNVRKLPGKTSTYLIPYSDLEKYLAYREARNRKRKSATAAANS